MSYFEDESESVEALQEKLENLLTEFNITSHKLFSAGVSTSVKANHTTEQGSSAAVLYALEFTQRRKTKPVTE